MGFVFSGWTNALKKKFGYIYIIIYITSAWLKFIIPLVINNIFRQKKTKGSGIIYLLNQIVYDHLRKTLGSVCRVLK